VEFRALLCPCICLLVNLFIASLTQHRAIKKYRDVEIRLLALLEIILALDCSEYPLRATAVLPRHPLDVRCGGSEYPCACCKLEAGPPRAGSGPGEEIFRPFPFPPPNKGGPARGKSTQAKQRDGRWPQVP